MTKDNFWMFDSKIGEGNFKQGKATLRLKAHVSEEGYSNWKAESEIIPIPTKRGRKVYVLAKPYILEPEILIEVGLYPEPREDRAIGEVTGSRWEGMKERDIGNAQAWYYLEDRILILWECYVYEGFREKHPLEDENLKLVWNEFEKFLLSQFARAGRIFTTSWEPIYETSLWHEFLNLQGYSRVNKRAFVKEV